MAWEVEYTVEFGRWWDRLSDREQAAVDAFVRELEKRGPALPFPYSSAVVQSRHPHMRELRPQYAGRPIRILYAFDPTRTAILLLGGDKTGKGRWYDENVPRADKLYDAHIQQLKREGKIPNG